MRCLWFWGDFGQPVSWSSGLRSFVAGEFAWYVLPWNLLALVWCLISVSVWRHLISSCQLMFLGVRSSLESGFGLKPPASSYLSYFTVVSKLLLLYSTIDKTSPFEDMGCFSGCLMSSASIQKLFCEIYSAFKHPFDEFVGEKVVSLSYSSTILGPSSKSNALFKSQIYKDTKWQSESLVH